MQGKSVQGKSVQGKSVRASLGVVVAVLVQFGCLPSVRDVVRDAVDEQAKRENWQKLREPARAMASEITRGIADVVASSEARRKIEQALDQYVRVFIAAAADEAGKDVPPSVAAAVRASVQAAVHEVLDDGVVHKTQDVADRLAFAAASGLSRGLALELRNDLGPAIAHVVTADVGPAVRDALTRDLGPGLAATLDRDLVPVLETASRRASTAAAEGFVDGAKRRIDPILDRAAARLDAALSEAQHGARSVAELLVVAALAVFATLSCFGMMLFARRARDRHDALHLVVGEISSMSRDPAIQELTHRIHHAGNRSRGADYLRSHLVRQPVSPAGASRIAPDPSPTG